MFAENAHQLLMRYKLPSHVVVDCLTILDQSYWCGIGKSFDSWESDSDPIQHVIPEENGKNQDEAVQHGFVIGGHRVLRSVRDQNQHQQVCDSYGARLSPKRTHYHEDKKIDAGAANKQF